MRPTDSPPVVYQSAPSGPVAMLNALRAECSAIFPPGAILAIFAPPSTNHSEPSRPAVIAPGVETARVATDPEAVIRPNDGRCSFVNQAPPSGPAVTATGATIAAP